MNCNYCGNPAECVTLRQLYGSKFPLNKWAWRCRPCCASVGCHGLTKTPLGTLAKEPLRRARNAAHAVFDPLWKQGYYSRANAYQLLADDMDMPAGDCHIANFNEDQCARVVIFATRHRQAIFQNHLRNAFQR